MMHTLTGVVVAAAGGDGIIDWINQLFVDTGTAMTSGVKVLLIAIGGLILWKSTNKVMGGVLAAVVMIFGWWAINNFDNTGIGDKIDNQTAMGQSQLIQVAPDLGAVVPGQVLHLSHPSS